MKWLTSFKFSLAILLLFLAATGYSQYQNLGEVKKVQKKPNPWFVGGMIGAGFTNGGGYFEVSPLVGYKITPDFHVGSRLTYRFVSYNYGGTTGKQNFNDFGASLFTRYRFLKMLFAHVEYEILSVEDIYINSNEHYRRSINSLYIGGGLYQSIGGRGFATIAILYNLLESENPYYSNPFIRIGFGVGL